MQRSGRPLAEAMKVMRHTNAKLTMVDYNDDAQIGSDPLPELTPPTPAPIPVTAAGGA